MQAEGVTHRRNSFAGIFVMFDRRTELRINHRNKFVECKAICYRTPGLCHMIIWVAVRLFICEYINGCRLMILMDEGNFSFIEAYQWVHTFITRDVIIIHVHWFLRKT